jgi:DNA-directed RNA polymerase subunit RPC12/RpoP
MCSVGGPPDIGDVEAMFAENYKCLDCGHAFKGLGTKPACPECRSKNVQLVK